MKEYGYFGEVIINGEIYQVTDNADYSNRLLSNNFNYHEVESGEEYSVEMQAPAIDKNNNEGIVYWIFWDIKGEEKELDTYNWDNASRFELTE